MRRRASPRFLAPQTKGTLKSCLLVDVVGAEGFEDAGLDEVADAGFGHYGDGDGFHDPLDDGGVGHAGNAAGGADIGRDPFEGHNGAGAGLFGDLSLFGSGHVHDYAAFEHLGQAGFYAEGSLFHCVSTSCIVHQL